MFPTRPLTGCLHFGRQRKANLPFQTSRVWCDCAKTMQTTQSACGCSASQCRQIRKEKESWKTGRSFITRGGRQRATADAFPKSRKDESDGYLPEVLGPTKERMVKGDALFFHQLLLPMRDPKMSGVNGDTGKALHSKAETFSNLHAIQIGLSGSCGHKFKNVVLAELLRFDGVVIRDRVEGGSNNGAVHRRWMNGVDCDSLMRGSMTHTGWLQLKRVMKLNDNHQTSLKRIQV
jgi:hypothetical protein